MAIRNRFNNPLLQLATASTLFGLGSLFVVFIDLHPVVIAFYRLLIASICFAAYLLVKRQSFKTNRHALLFASLAGIFLGVDLAGWNIGIREVGPGIATILNSLQIFFMAFSGIVFYSIRPNRLLWLSLSISFIGVIFLSLPEVKSNPHGLSGIIISIVSGAAFAAAMVLTKNAQKHQHHSVVNTVFYTSVAASLTTFLCAQFIGASASFHIPDSGSYIALFFYGSLVHVFAWFLMTDAVNRTSVTLVGLMMALEPVSVFLIDIGLLGKSIHIMQFIGAGMTIGAVYIGSQAGKQ